MVFSDGEGEGESGDSLLSSQMSRQINKVHTFLKVDRLRTRVAKKKQNKRYKTTRDNNFFLFFFIFFYFFIFIKKFMPISARGTTVAQANSECTLITTDYNKEVLKCDLNVESVGWFVILLDNEFHEDTVLGTLE